MEKCGGEKRKYRARKHLVLLPRVHPTSFGSISGQRIEVKKGKEKKIDNYSLRVTSQFQPDVISIRSIPLANFRALLNRSSACLASASSRSGETYQTNSGVHRSRAECLATKSRIITLLSAASESRPRETLFSLTRRGNLRIFN